jgi:hypothetical protein
MENITKRSGSLKDPSRVPRLNTSRGDPESRNYGKVPVDEGWDGKAVRWCVLSCSESLMGTDAVLIDENTARSIFTFLY